jgi:hypothetical protein
MRQHDRHNPKGRQVSRQIPVAGLWRQFGFSKGTAGASQVVAASHHNSSLGTSVLSLVLCWFFGCWFFGSLVVGSLVRVGSLVPDPQRDLDADGGRGPSASSQAARKPLSFERPGQARAANAL